MHLPNEVCIVEWPALSVMQLMHIGSVESIPQSVGQFIAWRKMHKLPPSKYRTFNLLYDDPETVEPQHYRFGLACEYSSEVTITATEPMEKLSIPAARAAKMVHIGSDSSMGESVKYLYQQWLLKNNEIPLDFPIIVERIAFYPDVPMHQAKSNIYVLLK